MKKYLLLVRHAQSQNNAIGNKFSGILNTPLTEKGREQAHVLSNKISNFKAETVLTSNLERAIETAKLAFPDLSVRVCKELLEFNYGDYDGVSTDECSPDDPVISQWKHKPGNLSFPGGQNIGDYTKNMWRGMHDLMTRVEESKIACIIHKTMGRLFIAKILGLNLDLFRSIPMDNCGVSIVIWDSVSGFQLHSLNMMIDLIAGPKETIWSW